MQPRFSTVGYFGEDPKESPELEQRVESLETEMMRMKALLKRLSEIQKDTSLFDRESPYVKTPMLDIIIYRHQLPQQSVASAVPRLESVAESAGVAQFFSPAIYVNFADATFDKAWIKLIFAILVTFFGTWNVFMQSYTVLTVLTLALGLVCFWRVASFSHKNLVRLVVIQLVYLILIGIGNQLDNLISIKIAGDDLTVWRTILIGFFALVNTSFALALAEMLEAPIPKALKTFTEKARKLLE